MRIAITMPTGKVGDKLVTELLDRGGHDLTLLTLNSSKLQDAAKRGAHVVQGKLEDMSFVTRATEGIQTLFFVLPMDSHSGHLFRDATRITSSICNAIKKNGIPRVVFVSSIGSHLEKGTGPINYLREAEQKLSEVAPNLTVLRPAFYMDQFMGWVKEIAEENSLFSPFASKTAIPMVATGDIARVAADVVTDSSWSGRRHLSIHGPREYSYEDVANIMSKTLGVRIKHVQVDSAEMANRLRRRGWSEEAVKSNLEMLETMRKGNISDEAPRTEWNVRPTTFEEFVAREFQPAFDRMAAVEV